MKVSVENLEKAKSLLSNGLNDRTNIVDVTGDELKNLVSTVGQMNNTAIADGEIVEFFTAEEYENNMKDYIQITETEPRNGGAPFQNLYALVSRYRLINGKKVAERVGFINVGGLVRRHFTAEGHDLAEKGGEITGAVRVITPTKFNEDLAAYQMPWSMLTQYLAGKKVKGTRSTTKHLYQRFVNRQPVENTYDYTTGMEYSFVK